VASVSARHNIFTPFILVPPVLLLSFLVCQPAAMRMDSSMRFPGPSFTAVMAKKLEASSLGLSKPAGRPARGFLGCAGERVDSKQARGRAVGAAARCT
jgi:hypothetical protein